MSTLLRETQPAQNRIAGYLPQHADENGNYVPTGENHPMPIKATGQIPTQQQSQLTPQEKYATAIAVNAGAILTVATISMDGYSQLGVGVVANASHNFTVSALDSPDGSTQLPSSFSKQRTGQTNAGSGVMSLNYAIVQITNSDASQRTYDVWVRKFN